MPLPRRTSSLASLALLGAVLVPTSLVTSPAHAMCASAGDIGYSLTGTSIRMPFSGIPTFKNGPGGTLSVTKDYSGSVSAQVTAGAESEVGAVFAKAKVSISASLTTSNSSTVTNNYSHVITAGKYGHAQYVSWGKKVAWKKYQINSTCTGTTTLATGTINFPATEEGWYYWETSS